MWAGLNMKFSIVTEISHGGVWKWQVYESRGSNSYMVMNGVCKGLSGNSRDIAIADAEAWIKKEKEVRASRVVIDYKEY